MNIFKNTHDLEEGLAKTVGVIFCLFTGITSPAQQLVSLASPTTDTYQNQQVLLENALRDLEKRYQVSIVYESELVEGRSISLPQTDEDISSAENELKKLLQSLPIQFKKIKSDVYLLVSAREEANEMTPIKPDQLEAMETISHSDFSLKKVETLQNARLAIVISGQVTNKDGEGIPGVIT